MFRWKKGLIVKINLDDGYFSYACLLDFPLVAFYQGKFNKEQSVDKITQLEILFKIWCHKSVKQIMEKVGSVELEKNLKENVKFYKYDSISKKYYIYDNGKETLSNYHDIKNLECAAVWESEHILERLNAELNGKESIFKKSLSPHKR